GKGVREFLLGQPRSGKPGCALEWQWNSDGFHDQSVYGRIFGDSAAVAATGACGQHRKSDVPDLHGTLRAGFLIAAVYGLRRFEGDQMGWEITNEFADEWNRLRDK